MDATVAKPSSVPPRLAAGIVVADKYELLRKLGTGAMGEVWAARHKTLGEEVAIKLVMRHADHGDGTTAESRFLLEARVAAQLSRKTRHIVAVTDHGQDGVLGYLVMELLEGEPLDARVERTGPLPIAKVAPMITQIARGLSIAHADGVVHRDLKPANVFVTVDEEGNAVAKVLDFGIAKLRRRDGGFRSAHATQRGFRLGTPAYMSPEQARGKPFDHRADVWALAVIAFHMLTGEFPFDGESAEELFARLHRAAPTSIRELRPDLPPVVEDFFARAFAPRVEDRFQSALALAGAFEQLEPLAAGAKLSLPAPPALAIIDHDFASVGLPKLVEQSSMIIAGLPRRNRLMPMLVAGGLVAAVIVSTVILLGVYFEREPARRASGLSPPVTTPDPNAGARPIPSPEPAVSSDDLAAAVTPPPRPARALPAPPSTASTDTPSAIASSISSITPEQPAPSPPAPVVAAPAPRAPRPVDKSEVF